MPSSHPIQCRCGQVRGLVQPTKPATRCVCYCKDCRAFARHLDAQADVLDAFGGTDVIQVPPAHVTLTHGQGSLACLRLTDKGMLRWYAACCNTPLGNTSADRRMSFVGLVHTCLRGAGASMDDSFGPVTTRTQVKSALGSPGFGSTGELGGIARVLGFVAKARLTGSYRKTPFFHAETGAPVVVPRVLSAAELVAAHNDGP